MKRNEPSISKLEKVLVFEEINWMLYKNLSSFTCLFNQCVGCFGHHHHTDAVHHCTRGLGLIILIISGMRLYDYVYDRKKQTLHVHSCMNMLYLVRPKLKSTKQMNKDRLYFCL